MAHDIKQSRVRIYIFPAFFILLNPLSNQFLHPLNHLFSLTTFCPQRLRFAAVGNHHQVLERQEIRWQKISACFNDSVLVRCDFSNAIVNGAIFDNANLCGDILQFASYEKASFNDVVYNSVTIWPEGFEPIKNGAILID